MEAIELDISVACVGDVAVPFLTHPCSLTGGTAPPSPHEFQGKSCTRMVSKFHFGRRSPNTGRRSFQAEAAVEELKALPGMSTPQGQAQFALCVDQFWQSGGGAMEDVAFVIKELGNQGEWHKALALFHWLVDKQEVRLKATATAHWLPSIPSHPSATCRPVQVAGSGRFGSAAEYGRIASATISLLGRHGQVDAARSVFERAKGSGMGSNVFTYSALLSAYGNSCWLLGTKGRGG